jgi:murein DD-endopeptidase MepM/ murein hydrolase activator NlpD
MGGDRSGQGLAQLPVERIQGSGAFDHADEITGRRAHQSGEEGGFRCGLHGQTIDRPVRMNLIIVSKFFKAPKKLSLAEPRAIAICGTALLAILAVGATAGFAIRGADGSAMSEISALRLQLRLQLQNQQDDLDAARGDAQRELNAMAMKLAELQAHANRLNALGERLTRIGRLDDGEFDFEAAPGVGGPRSLEPVEAATSAGLESALDLLDARMTLQTQQLGVLESLLLDRDVDASILPTGLPVRTGYASSGFGQRSDPFTGFGEFHSGVDFNGARGSDILSVADGVVSFAGNRSGYGNMVDIDHGNGYMTRYGHNTENLVKPGQRVRVGQVIAKMGATGRATGNHVHFEVWLNDRPVNPTQYLRKVRG